MVALRSDLRLLWGSGPVRTWMLANAVWKAAAAALRTFVVLYFTRGLDVSLSSPRSRWRWSPRRWPAGWPTASGTAG